MSREGSVFRRCAACGRRSSRDAGRRCEHACPDNGRVTWAYVIDVAPAGARRRRSVRSGFDTHVEASDALEQFKGEIARGVRPDADRHLKLGDYLAEWLVGRRGLVGSGLRESTWRENERHVRLYIDGHLGEIRLRDLDRVTVKSWAGHLRAFHELAAGTVLNAVRTLSRALNDAIEDGLLDRNVAAGTWRVRPEDRVRGAAWTPEEVRAFLRSVEDDRFRALWRLLLAVGCRRGEAVGLNWEHLDLKSGVITVAQAYVSGIDGYSIQPTKTGRIRRVRLDKGTADALHRHREQQQFERRSLGLDPEPPPGSPVFVNPAGERINPEGISARWAKLCAVADIRRIRLHDARHTAATSLLDRQVPVHQVSALLGHSSPVTTHATYSHVIDGAGEAVAIVMGDILDGDQAMDDTAVGTRWT